MCCTDVVYVLLPYESEHIFVLALVQPMLIQTGRTAYAYARTESGVRRYQGELDIYVEGGFLCTERQGKVPPQLT